MYNTKHMHVHTHTLTYVESDSWGRCFGLAHWMRIHTLFPCFNWHKIYFTLRACGTFTLQPRNSTILLPLKRFLKVQCTSIYRIPTHIGCHVGVMGRTYLSIQQAIEHWVGYWLAHSGPGCTQCAAMPSGNFSVSLPTSATQVSCGEVNEWVNEWVSEWVSVWVH